MANEISNRGQAGAFIQVFPAPAPPVFLGGWGVKPATLQRRAVFGVGSYTIDLEAPGSGIINPALTDFVSLAQLVQFSGFTDAGGVITAALSIDPDYAGPPIVGGRPVNLSVIVFRALDSDGAPVDAEGGVSIEVRAFPQQT